jgi:hypothetical protein
MSIQKFRDNFYGLRPNRFRISGRFPTGVEGPSENFNIYVKAADLPASTIGAIPVAWQGRVVKFSGERVYSDWVISVYDSNVVSDSLRLGFERWVDAMDGRNTHNIAYNLVEDWEIFYNDLNGQQFSSDQANFGGQYGQGVLLKNCFPVEVGPVQLNYDATDTFAEFTVQIAYDYWEPTGSGVFVGPAGNLA